MCFFFLLCAFVDEHLGTEKYMMNESSTKNKIVNNNGKIGKGKKRKIQFKQFGDGGDGLMQHCNYLNGFTRFFFFFF